MSEQSFWRKCAVCKIEIKYNQTYVKCSVSTCRKNIYCSDRCWDVHVPVLNHKSAWAEDEKAPAAPSTSPETINNLNERPRRRIVSSSKPSNTDSNESSDDYPIDILIVASKLKNYVKERYDMNTSASVMNALSDVVRQSVDQAILKARQDGRKTLMDRDF